MATNQTVKDQLAKRNGSSSSPLSGIREMLSSAPIRKRFEEVMKDRAPQFMSSIINLVASDTTLQKSDPMSVISSCMVAATLDLPVDKNLGYAWIVPYFDKRSGKYIATFQIGYKGYVQLALRTGKYRSINVIDVHEGELVSWNPLTEELSIDFEAKKSDAVIGYAGYFELINGFRKAVYWTREQIEAHRQKYSKSDFGWKNDYNAMARKTVIRNMLSKWGILSIEMQKAVSEDISKETEPTKDLEVIEGDFSFVETEPEQESEAAPESNGAADAEQDVLDFGVSVGG